MAIGIGVWACNINNMFFKGEAKIEIRQNEQGEYQFNLKMNQPLPDYKIERVQEEGNTLIATISTSMLPGKSIEAHVDFENDTCSGYLSVPFIGKIKFKDGKKVAE